MAFVEAYGRYKKDDFKDLLRLEAGGGPIGVAFWYNVEDRFHVAKVATRGGCCGTFGPFREGGSEICAGDVGDVDLVATAVHMA